MVIALFDWLFILLSPLPSLPISLSQWHVDSYCACVCIRANRTQAHIASRSHAFFSYRRRGSARLLRRRTSYVSAIFIYVFASPRMALRVRRLKGEAGKGQCELLAFNSLPLRVYKPSQKRVSFYNSVWVYRPGRPVDLWARWSCCFPYN